MLSLGKGGAELAPAAPRMGLEERAPFEELADSSARSPAASRRENFGRTAWEFGGVPAIPHRRGVWVQSSLFLVLVQVGHGGSRGSLRCPQQGRTAWAHPNSLEHRREEQPEAVCAHPRAPCPPWPGEINLWRVQQLPRATPGIFWEPPAPKAPWHARLSRICRSQHVSPTSAQLPSCCWGTLVAFFNGCFLSA